MLHGQPHPHLRGACLVQIEPKQVRKGCKALWRTVLMILSALVNSSALAEQPYEPPISYERMADRYIVNADGSFRQICEVTFELRLHRQSTPKVFDALLTPAVGRPSNLSKHGSSNRTEPK